MKEQTQHPNITRTPYETSTEIRLHELPSGTTVYETRKISQYNSLLESYVSTTQVPGEHLVWVRRHLNGNHVCAFGWRSTYGASGGDAKSLADCLAVAVEVAKEVDGLPIYVQQRPTFDLDRDWEFICEMNPDTPSEEQTEAIDRFAARVHFLGLQMQGRGDLCVYWLTSGGQLKGRRMNEDGEVEYEWVVEHYVKQTADAEEFLEQNGVGDDEVGRVRGNRLASEVHKEACHIKELAEHGLMDEARQRAEALQAQADRISELTDDQSDLAAAWKVLAEL